jgi:hypothetical protein
MTPILSKDLRFRKDHYLNEMTKLPHHSFFLENSIIDYVVHNFNFDEL